MKTLYSLISAEIIWISRAADDFDAFVLVDSAGSRCWLTARVMSFHFPRSLDTEGKGTTMVHGTSCHGVGDVGDDACLDGFSYVKRCPAESI